MIAIDGWPLWAGRGVIWAHNFGFFKMLYSSIYVRNEHGGLRIKFRDHLQKNGILQRREDELAELATTTAAATATTTQTLSPK